MYGMDRKVAPTVEEKVLLFIGTMHRIRSTRMESVTRKRRREAKEHSRKKMKMRR